MDYVTKEPTKRVRINRDSIRKMFGKYWVLEREELCNEIEDKAIAYAMVRGFEVVIDDTNLNPKTIKHIKELVLNVDSNADIRYNLFNTPLTECVTRVEKRNASLPKDEQIPISVVLETFDKYKEEYGLIFK